MSTCDKDIVDYVRGRIKEEGGMSRYFLKAVKAERKNRAKEEAVRKAAIEKLSPEEIEALNL